MRSTTRRPRTWASVLFVLVCELFVLTGSAGGAQTVKVWYLQGEQMSALSRSGTSAEDALRQLLRGPTAAETRRGVETYVPAGTKLRSVTVADGLATVDLSLKFGLGRDGASLLARLSQVVHTATGPEGAKRVKPLVQGGVPLGLFPGVSLGGRPITVDYLETPNVPVPKPPAEKRLPVDDTVRNAQQRLAQLGYFLPTGRCDVVVYDAPALGTLKARAPDRYGPFVGVIKTGERYGIAMPKESPLVAPVNKALTSLLADGSVDALARQWLTFDPSEARVLR
jgi:hypothetical protein